MSSRKFSTYSVVLVVLVTLNVCHLQPTLNWPSNVNAIQKLLCGLKMFSKSLMKHFKDSGSRFTELHTKLDADTLLNFAIHCRQNETRIQKSTRVKTMHVDSAKSRGRMMQ
jgi:hypothetical protein